jgi:hypothetical protein
MTGCSFLFGKKNDSSIAIALAGSGKSLEPRHQILDHVGAAKNDVRTGRCHADHRHGKVGIAL